MQVEQVEKESRTYKCRIIDTKKGKVYIDYPIDEGAKHPDIFRVGTPLHIHFIENNSLFSFPSEIIGKAKLNNIPTLILSFELNNLKQIQRREFVRVETLLDVSVQSIENKFTPIMTVTHDISGGGLAILVGKDDNVNQGDLLDIMLILPLDNKLEYIHIIGKAVRIQGKKKEKDILSVKFDDIDLRDQQLIVQYCFTRQLEDRKKGYL